MKPLTLYLVFGIYRLKTKTLTDVYYLSEHVPTALYT